MNYEAYRIALLEQVNVHANLLDQLRDRPWPLGQIERTAAERSLQLLAEAAIGCSKQLNRRHNLPDRADAFQHVEQSAVFCRLPAEWLPQLKGAIGMRNAIVHDYLNLDWELIGEVIRQRKYIVLVDFTRGVCDALCR